ncbi:MAG: hypothetical protein R3B45_18240 [Bdellovibrionota bacterium]
MEAETKFTNEANDRIPLAVLGGATPLEIISGAWTKEKLRGWLLIKQLQEK